MKNKKNVALIVFLSLLFLIGAITIVLRLLQDENQLTVTEKHYITDNKSSLISVNVANDINIFGSAGTGVFYDFLSDFEETHELSFNIMTSSVNSTVSGLSFNKGANVPENAKVFYTDHYVLVGKQYVTVPSISSISGTIGILTKDISSINIYQQSSSLTVKNYETKESLITGLKNDECSYILVPMVEYLDVILDNLYYINYHFSDLKDYYFMTPSDDAILSSILGKFYNGWSEENFELSFNQNEYKLFTNKLKITEKEIDVINSKEYTYGFIANSPYETKKGGTYGGIANVYLEEFSKFSGITFNPKEFSNVSKLDNAVSKNNVDLFVNYYGNDYNASKIDSLYTLDISIVMSNTDSRTYTNIEALKSIGVYAKENSLVKKYLESKNIPVITYKKESELKKIFKKNNIVAMDRMNYLIYREGNTNVNERFVLNTSSTYNFISKNDTMFNRLFSYYISTFDKNEIMYSGIANYNNALKSGTIIYNITKYAVIIIAVIAGITYVIYKFGRRVHIRKKIKKADKMKYIDMLTSLKNRNFMSENLSIWNQNTIYPQAVIVIDLNGVQELNDSFGYYEGDKQIQAAANVLIKTQLDNSEIMRTDGNEFTIYMINYSEKQVLSYIKKLNKEFKNLPHDKGAAIGFSMIEDDLKLIDDAINEATEKMKENKELAQGEADENKI